MRDALAIFRMSLPGRGNSPPHLMTCRLPNATQSAVQRLRKAVEVDCEKTWDMNEKKIELRCGEVQRRIEVMLVTLILIALHTRQQVHTVILNI